MRSETEGMPIWHPLVCLCRDFHGQWISAKGSLSQMQTRRPKVRCAFACKFGWVLLGEST